MPIPAAVTTGRVLEETFFLAEIGSATVGFRIDRFITWFSQISYRHSPAVCSTKRSLRLSRGASLQLAKSDRSLPSAALPCTLPRALHPRCPRVRLLAQMVFLSFSCFKFPQRDDYSLLANWQLLGISCGKNPILGRQIEECLMEASTSFHRTGLDRVPSDLIQTPPQAVRLTIDLFPWGLFVGSVSKNVSKNVSKRPWNELSQAKPSKRQHARVILDCAPVAA